MEQVERQQQLSLFAGSIMVLLCGLWGLQQVAIKVAMEGISPILQAGVRSIIAIVLLSIWMQRRRIPVFEQDGAFIPGFLAGVLFTVEFFLIYWGLSYTTASRAVIFLYTTPFFVALGFALFVPSEKLSKIQIAGMVLAFCGIVVVFSEGLSAPDDNQWKGDVMIFAGAALWGGTTVLVRATRLTTIAPSRTLYYQLLVSAIFLPIASMAFGESGVTQITPAIIASLLFQSVIVAFASYLTWFWLIAHYPASRLSAYTFLTPLFGVMFGVSLLSEPLTGGLILGLILVASGIYVVNKKAAPY